MSRKEKEENQQITEEAANLQNFEFINSNDLKPKEETEDYSEMPVHVFSSNTKMMILCGLMMLWFISVFFLRTAGYVSDNISLLLCLPPFIIIAIVYFMHQRKNKLW